MNKKNKVLLPARDWIMKVCRTNPHFLYSMENVIKKCNFPIKVNIYFPLVNNSLCALLTLVIYLSLGSDAVYRS